MKERLAVINRELCTNRKCGYQCMKACPVNRSGEECIIIEHGGIFPVINEELCIGCSLCIKKCDKLEFNAIDIVNLPKELAEEPLHRYGVNRFSLYRLPQPEKGMVVGLIGPNGVGKSTALNIFSGNLVPNGGSLKGVGWEQIIERFRGSKLHEYMKSLQEKRLSVGYKPQHVDLIPKMQTGKVASLLKGENRDEIIKRLDLGNMLDKDIPSLSGGELQLLAVAATMAKDCDFYFFDEPSSYLDVKQRMLVAGEIRRLAQDKAVIVVEHDLAVLDYLSDHIHILYGAPGVFGIVSKPQVVRAGINTYLEGHLKEENIRIREKAVHFSKIAPSSEKDSLNVPFDPLEKKFEGFSLKTDGGSLNKGEIVGILGPNGIGKTTFIKMLVGELKPDKGEPIEGFRLSYKPQRLVLTAGEERMQVSEFLESHVGSKLVDSDYKRLLSLLRVERNLQRTMGKLSGGELQAVFIAASLGKEHDLLLLDEPSAFLDVEQRLSLSKIVRSHVEGREISCFIIDHDLQVIDSLADRIMVFSGKPGIEGFAKTPEDMRSGMNAFLRTLGLTFRRDPQTGRPRVNKPESQKDREQRASGEYYYTG